MKFWRVKQIFDKVCGSFSQDMTGFGDSEKVDSEYGEQWIENLQIFDFQNY